MKKPDNGPSEHNMGELLSSKARRERREGRDPRPALAEARAALGRALKLNPDFAPSLVVLGQVGTLEARWAVSKGGDPEPALAGAEAAFERAHRGAADDVRPLVGLANASRVRAEKLGPKAGEKARRNALAFVDHALRLQSNDAEALAVRGSLLMLAPGAASDEARALLEQAFQRDPALRLDYGSYGSGTKTTK